MTMEAIVAYDSNKGISKHGLIPWKISDDMKFFKNTTIKNVVIMGKNTFESLNNKPLIDRLNVVLTNTPEKYFNYSIMYSNLLFTDNENIHLDIIRNANEYGYRYHFLNKHFKIFYIGGESVYKKFIPLCKIVWVTKIKENYKCDLFFTHDLDHDENFTHNEVINTELFDIIKYTQITKDGN